jgi:hypothetical protein
LEQWIEKKNISAHGICFPYRVQVDKEKGQIIQLLPHLGQTLKEWKKSCPQVDLLAHSLILFYQIAYALSLFHPYLTHGDLSPKNIMVKSVELSDGSTWPVAHLIDFGATCLLLPGAKNQPLTTLSFSAPEVHHNLISSPSFSPANDVFSLALLVLYLVYDNQETEESTNCLTLCNDSIFVPQCWTRKCEEEKVDEELISLLRKMLRMNPEKRPSVHQVMESLISYFSSREAFHILFRKIMPSFTSSEISPNEIHKCLLFGLQQRKRMDLGETKVRLHSSETAALTDTLLLLQPIRSTLVQQLAEWCERLEVWDVFTSAVVLMDMYHVSTGTLHEKERKMFPTYVASFLYLATLIHRNDRAFSTTRFTSHSDSFGISSSDLLSMVIDILITLNFDIFHPCIIPSQWNISNLTWQHICEHPRFSTLSHAQLVSLAQEKKSNLSITKTGGKGN